MSQTSNSETYKPFEGAEKLYPKSYFALRTKNDPKRLRQFLSEGAFIRKHISSGVVCDIGCSTGEFLEVIDWTGPKFGMEISTYARALAEQSGISFSKNIFTEENFFDLVLFRGTIQHLDEPFRFIKQAFLSLKPGGYIVFLATPNINSPYYRATQTLPFINKEYNFYLPDDINFSSALSNFGFLVKEIRLPYLKTPYARPFWDHLKFSVNFIARRQVLPHAFWKSSMELIAQKPLP